MRGTQGADHAVDGQHELARLQPFLQFGFGVFAQRLHFGFDLDLGKQAFDQGVGSVVASIQIHRAQHGFKRIGQDGGALVAARAHFALTQAHDAGQAQLQRQAVQRVLFDQVGANAREVTFWQAAQLFEQQMRHTQIEHRVAQKLQTLVVVGAEAAVRQSALQQSRLRKVVLQALLQRVQGLLWCGL